MPRTIEQLEQLEQTGQLKTSLTAIIENINDINIVSIENIIDLLKECALIEISINDGNTLFVDINWIEEIAKKINDERIKELDDRQQYEVFYLTSYKNILPIINPTTITKYLTEHNPIGNSDLENLALLDVISYYVEHIEQHPDLALLSLKTIIKAMHEPYFQNPQGEIDLYLVSDFKKILKHHDKIIREKIYNPSQELIKAARQNQWMKVLQITQAKTLPDFTLDQSSLNFTLAHAASEQIWDVVRQILEMHHSHDIDSITITMMEAARNGCAEVLEAIFLRLDKNKAIINLIPQALSEAASSNQWQIVLILLEKIRVVLREINISNLIPMIEHTLEKAAKKGQVIVVCEIITKYKTEIASIRTNTRCLTRALLLAQENKHHHIVIALSKTKGLALTENKLIKEAITTSKQLISSDVAEANGALEARGTSEADENRMRAPTTRGQAFDSRTAQPRNQFFESRTAQPHSQSFNSRTAQPRKPSAPTPIESIQSPYTPKGSTP